MCAAETAEDDGEEQDEAAAAAAGGSQAAGQRIRIKRERQQREARQQQQQQQQQEAELVDLTQASWQLQAWALARCHLPRHSGSARCRWLPEPAAAPALNSHPFSGCVLYLCVQAVNPADEVLAAKRQGQELECDLTGGDEEAPEWRAAKRPAISLA